MSLILVLAGASCAAEDRPDPIPRPRPTGEPRPEERLNPTPRPFGEAPPAPSAWPSFRGDERLTGVAKCSLPAAPELLWKLETKSSVKGTAAIAGGRAYVATEDGQLICLDIATGKPRWTYEAKEPIEASPCVGGDKFSTVFVGDKGTTFHAVEAATGKARWTFKAQAEIYSSANVAGDSVLFGAYDNSLYCLAAADGKEKWKFTTGAQVHCGPCVTKDAAAVAGCDGALRAIGLKDGDEIAGVPLESRSAASPAFDGKRFYVGTLEGRMLCVDAGEKKIVWAVEPKERAEIRASAAVTEGRAIFAGRDKIVRCLDPRDGKELWAFEAAGSVDSSPAIAGESVYFGCDAGDLYALDLKSGRKTWTFKAGAALSAGPAIGEGRLVIGSEDGAVYCFGSKEKR